MAETDKISQIKLPNNDTYNINDSYAIHKDGSLGDILYWSDNNTPTTLSGNTTTTRKFLRSVATTAGTAVAPAWDTIQSEDLPLALYNAKGAIKPAYTTTGTASLGTTSQAYSNSPAISSRTTTSSRFYALEADKNGVGYTNVPWTDKNVFQDYNAASSYSNWRPLLVGSSNGSTSSFTPADVTAQVYTFNTLLVQPSTGTIKATTFDGNATTATKWASAQTAYVNLGNASTTTSIQGGSSNAAILGVNGVLGTANGGTGFSSTVYVNSVVIGNSTTATDALQTIRTGNGAFYATEEDGVPDFGTLPVAQGGTGRTSFTANEVVMSGSTTTSALTTRSITNNTSATAVTASTNIITANTLYYHTGNSNLTTVGTVTTGTWNATTIDVQHGGTGATSFTANSAIISGSTTTSALTTRAITNNTSATAVTASTNLITANTLYYHKGNSNIVTVGTITSGTWQGTTVGTGYGGTGVASHTANRLVWSTSATAIQAANHYASSTQVSIGTESAPDSEYKLRVEGNLEAAGVINIITNTRTRDLYFSNGTPGSCGVAGRIMYDIGTGPNITKSQMCLVENSYSSTASATPIIYGEYYYLPACTAGLTQNLSYNILTTKNTVTVAQGGTGVTSHTANRLVWSTSATTIQATDAHYVSATQMSIASNTAPDSNYVLKVNGNSQHIGAINIKSGGIVNSIYSQTGNGNIGRIYQWFRSSGNTNGNIAHSQWVFQEWSYNSTTPSNNPLSYYEQYLLPDCDANLSANKDYNIITEKNLTDITKVGTITTGTWNASTLGIAYGGTGATTASRGFEGLTCQGVVPSTVTSLDDIKAAGYYWVNSSNTPNGWPPGMESGTQYGLLEVVGSNAYVANISNGILIQRLSLYSSSTFVSRLWANGTWYDWNYNISSRCNSNLARTIKSDLYVGGDARPSIIKLTRADKAVGFEIYEDFGRALTSTDYSVSANLCGFLVHSYSTSVSDLSPTPCNLSSYSENYYFPPVNPDLTASVAYYILTTKQYPSAISGRAVPSGATFDTMTTAGVYNIANNCSGYPTTSGTNYNYGILLVATTASPNGSQSNMFQLYLGGSTNASYYKLWIRSRYNKNWKDWKQVTLT